jgi:hypothetical protein
MKKIPLILSLLALSYQGYSQGGIRADGGVTIRMMGAVSLVTNGNVQINTGATFNSAAASTIKLDGATQNANFGAGTTLGNLEIAGTGNKTLQQNVGITTNLNFSGAAASLLLGANNITVNQGATVTGASQANGYVVTNNTGRFLHGYTTFANKTFPIGDATNYTPLTLNMTAATGTGTVGVNVVGGSRFASADATNYLNRYWNIMVSGLTGVQGDLSGVYASGELVGTNVKPAYHNGTAFVYGSTNISTSPTTSVSVNPFVASGVFTGSASVIITPPSPNSALNFDGVNDAAKLGSTNTALLNTSTNTVSFEAWVNPTSAQATWAGIITSRTPTLLKGAGLSITNGNEVRMMWNNLYYTLPTNITLSYGTWTHLAMTVSSGDIKIYKNGVLAYAYTGIIDMVDFSNMGKFVGRDAYYASRFFNGSIDEVRVWNTTRSVSEISANVNCQLTGSETGLVGLYNFNDASINAGGSNAGRTTALDLAGTADNATLTGFGLTGTTSNWVSSSTNTSCIPISTVKTEDLSVTALGTHVATDLLVYPNPATATLNISFSDDYQGQVNLKLTDVSGREVWSSVISKDSSVYQTTVNLSDMASGTYILEVNGKAKMVRKVVKQ